MKTLRRTKVSPARTPRTMPTFAPVLRLDVEAWGKDRDVESGVLVDVAVGVGVCGFVFGSDVVVGGDGTVEAEMVAVL